MIRRLLLAIVSGGLLTLAYPTPGWGWLSWAALAPLVLAVTGLTWGRALAIGWAGSFVAALGTVRWIVAAPDYDLRHLVASALVIGSYAAAWSVAVAATAGRGAAARAVLLPALWVILDFSRLHAGFLSIPWGTLAWTQAADLPMLQVASVTGEYGVTFLVVAGNVALADAVARRGWRTPAAVAAAVLLAHLWGWTRLADPGGGPTMTVAAVQACIQPEEGWTEEQADRLLDRLVPLTMEAAARGASLVVWPESAVRVVPPAERIGDRLQGLCRGLGIALITGVAETTKTRIDAGGGRFDLRAVSHNAAYLILPDGSVPEPYRKRLIVPFGEYLPWRDSFPWPDWLALRHSDTVRGDRFVTFALPGGRTAAPIICWENVFPPFVREAAASSPDLIIHITNDIRWGASPGAMQHNAATVLRAVELGRGAVVASNAGPSALIDHRGRVVAGTRELMEPGVVVAGLPVAGGATVYARFGNWFLPFAGLAAAAVLVGGRGRRRAGVDKSPGGE